MVYHRKHHAEIGQTPLERFRQNPNPAARPIDPETLHQAFLHRVERKRYSLPPLDLAETASYVKHHLKLASFDNRQLFSDSFVASLHDHAKGIPRLINNICRAALLLGATENKQILDETDLKRVILDLNGQLD